MSTEHDPTTQTQLPPPPDGADEAPAEGGTRSRRPWILVVVGAVLAVLALAGGLALTAGGDEGESQDMAEAEGQTADPEDEGSEDEAPEDEASDEEAPDAEDPEAAEDASTDTPDGELASEDADGTGSGGSGGGSGSGRAGSGGGSSGSGGSDDASHGQLVVDRTVGLPDGVTHGRTVLRNTGDAPLNWQASGMPRDDFSPASGEILPGAQVTLEFDLQVEGVGFGDWQRTFTVHSDAGQAEVTVDGHFLIPGDIEVPADVSAGYDPVVDIPVRHVGETPVEVRVHPGGSLALHDDSSVWLEPGESTSIRVALCDRPFVSSALSYDHALRDVELEVVGQGRTTVDVTFFLLPGPAEPGCPARPI